MKSERIQMQVVI